MRISVLGPSNLEKFEKLTGLSQEEINKKAKLIGETLAHNRHEMVVVFGYEGMQFLAGNAYRSAGGKLRMLSAPKDERWDVKKYQKNIKYADVIEDCEGWHDILLRLVSDSDIVIVAGLSAGVLAELAYMKFNVQESKGNVKRLIGITDLLRDNKIPPELEIELKHILEYATSDELEKVLQS